MLSRTSEHALRAMIYLAQCEEEWPISGKRIAGETEIPQKYLSKVLGDLVRLGILESTRGVGGGFRMSRSPKQIALLEVLAPYEYFHLKRCPFGNKECGDEDPCLAHEGWKKVIQTQQKFLMKTSIYDVAIPKSSKQKPAGKKRAKKK